MSGILSKLNPAQREAVIATEGPVLIIAGAGSGKTRALTHRVAYLICDKGVDPGKILAVTFTNKAAQEMKAKIAGLLSGRERGELPLVGTFHSICVRILRKEIQRLGYKASFNIFDDQDQLALMKKVMRNMEINIEQFRPRAILSSISKAKNELVGVEEFSLRAGSYYEDAVSKIYSNYQKKLKEQNALDFDDIIMLTVEIFKKFPDILEKYQNTFRYIMVDEYQDTNHAQYTLVKMITDKHRNICVVGDDWQGIYSWRGANIQNILDFEKDYPDAVVVKLEQNYRSTQPILDAAYAVISKNINRKDKKIWTQNKEGRLITSFEAKDERDEAQFVALEVMSLKNTPEFRFSNFVVLYRTNAQSRIIEEVMLKNSIPYRIIGGIKFYQRKEIKDVIAYLRLIQSFSDEISLERIINEPKRNIGGITLNKWIASAKKNNIDLIEAGLQLGGESKITSSRVDSISKFCEFIRRMAEAKNKLPLTDFIQKVFFESGYEKYLSDGTEEGEMRYENVKELLTVAKKYEEFEGEEGLKLFLEEVALVSDTDNINQEEDSVHMMTLHSAKGLEFRTVFIVGLEEGILPHSRSMLSGEEMEEERRLMYVGITRAKEKVYLLFVRERNIFGSTQVNPPSRFLDDIPEHLIDPDPKQKIRTANLNLEIAPETSSPVKKENRFKDGDRVYHEVFGEGTIVATQGDILTVAFSKSGLKILSALIAPLRKI